MYRHHMMSHYLTRIHGLFRRIGQRPTLKKVGQNTLWLVFEKGGISLVSFVVGIVVARYLTPSGYGTLATLNNLLGLLVTFASLGLEPIIQQQLIRYPRQHAAILYAALSARFVSAMVISLLLVISQYWAPGPWGWGMVALMGAGMIGNALSIVRSYYEAHMLIKPIVIIQLLILMLTSLMKVMGVWYQWPVTWFFFTFIVETIMGGVLGLLFLSLTQLRWALPSLRLIRHLVRRAWPMWLLLFTMLGHNRLDQWLLYHWSTPYQTGLYALAVRFCEYAVMIPTLILSVSQPVLQPLKHQNPTLFRDRLAQLSGLMTLGSLVIIGLLWLGSAGLFEWLYGSAYTPSIKMVWVYAGCFLGWAQWPVCHIYMMSSRRASHWTLINAMGLIPYGVLLTIMVPLWGGMGAAAASVITVCLTTLGLPALFPSTRPLCGIYWQGMTLRSLRGMWHRWWSTPPLHPTMSHHHTSQ
ncbi:flippase [bacterium]|nr:flippase [bacterium]